MTSGPLANLGGGVAHDRLAVANPALYRLMYSHRHGSADSAAVRATYFTLASRSLVQGIAAIALNDRLAPARTEDIAVAVRLFVDGLRASLA